MSRRGIAASVALSFAGTASAQEQPAAQPPVALPAAASAAAAPAAEDNRIQITVDADDPSAIVERRVNSVEGWQTTFGIPVFTTTQQWEPACVTPCSVKVDPHSAYRATGNGVATSGTFVLPQGRSAASLHVHARSSFWYGAGAGLTTTGGVLALVGGISTFYAKSITSTDAETTLRGFGLAFLVTGAVFIAVGLPLWLSGKSSVTLDDGRGLARRAAEPGLPF